MWRRLDLYKGLSFLIVYLSFFLMNSSVEFSAQYVSARGHIKKGAGDLKR